jgi:hypothetical protein
MVGDLTGMMGGRREPDCAIVYPVCIANSGRAGEATEETEVKSSTIWLRVSYWVGAVADGIVAAVMFAQAILALPSPLTRYVPETPSRYAMGLAGSLMLGWTILLLWADRRPVERRGVLIITIVVILGLMGSSVFSLSDGFMPGRSVVPVLVFQVALIAMFAFSYVASRRAHESRPSRLT